MRHRAHIVQGQKITHAVLWRAFKGIVSRDLGGLQMILLQRLEVFIISASNSFLFLSSFSYRIFKNGRLSGASFQHNPSNDQYRSGDSNSLAESRKVMRRMLPGSPRSSLEFPGKLVPQICRQGQLWNVNHSKGIDKKWKFASVSRLFFMLWYVGIFLFMFLYWESVQLSSSPSDSLTELLLECCEQVHSFDAIFKCESRHAKQKA